VTLGDWVIWDDTKFTTEGLASVKAQFGDEPLQVMSLPFATLSCGMPYALWVHVGRMGCVLTATNPDNLIKVAIKWPR